MSTSNKDTSSPWRIVVLQAVAVFLTLTITLMLSPLLIDLAREFNTSVPVTGQLAAVTFAAWGLSALLVVPFSDVYGRRPIMLTGASLLTIGVMTSGFANSYSMLVVARIITGIGGAMIPPTGMAAISDHFSPEKRGRALGLALGGASLAGVLGVPLIAVIADIWGWRWAFYLVGASLIPVWGLLWFWFPPGDVKRKGGIRTVLANYRGLIKTRQVLYIVSGNAFQRLAFFGGFTYLAAYLMQTYDKSEGQVAIPLAIAGFGMSLGGLLGSELASRPKRLNLVVVLILAGGIGGGLLYLTPLSLWVGVGLGMTLAVLLTAVLVPLIAITNDVAGESKGTAMGLFACSNQIGGFLGSAIGGLVLALWGFSATGVLWMAACGLSALLVLTLVRESTAFREFVNGGLDDDKHAAVHEIPR